MYSKKAQGWLKHLDFIILDMICLQVAFILAYMTRHGLGSPYTDPVYFNLALVYTLVDLLVLITNRTMKNVLKRGYYVELEQTVKHVALVTAAVAVYLFSIQLGEVYSRIMFYLQILYYTVLSYIIRLVWKQMVLRKKKDDVSTAIFFITTSDRAERVLNRYRQNSIIGRLIQGLCLLDQDLSGQSIAGVDVVANRDSLLRYLQDKWVDEVFISLPHSYPHPAGLISAIADMGMVVHVEMEQLEVEKWQHQTIQKIAGTTVRTVSMTMATPLQAMQKRILDILGGVVGCIITLLLAVIIGPIISLLLGLDAMGMNGDSFVPPYTMFLAAAVVALIAAVPIWFVRKDSR